MQAFCAKGSPPVTQIVLHLNSATLVSTSESAIISPPENAYSVSHHTQRRGQPVRRTNTVGKPTRDDSPWMEWKISLMRSRGSAMMYYLIAALSLRLLLEALLCGLCGSAVRILLDQS